MSLRTKLILSLGFGGVLFLLIVTVLVFDRMELAVKYQLEKEFYHDADLRIANLNTFFTDQRAGFQLATRLPMFRSMRFHQLTLNDAALKNDIRQMELHFFDLINQSDGLSKVKYFNKKGLEVFRVESSGIKRNLSNMSQDTTVVEMLKLGSDDIKIIKEIAGDNAQNVTWWMPVYVSPEIRTGVIAFSMDFQYFLKKFNELAISESDRVCVTDGMGNMFLSTHESKICVNGANELWSVTENIDLPGLFWVITLSINPDIFLAEIRGLRNIIFGAIFPLVALALFGFAVIFSNQIISAIKQLIDAAHVMGRGELISSEMLYRSDELGELAKVMHQSAVLIRNSRQELIEAKRRDIQSIMDNSPAVIFIKDINGRYTFVNHQYEKLFHVNRENIKGKTDHDIFPEKNADELRRNDKAVLDAGHALESEEIVAHDDGMHTYVSVRFPLFEESGGIYAVCGIATDITEHISDEKYIDRQAQLLDLMFQHTLDNIAILDKDLNFIRVSNAYADFCGRDAFDLHGEKYFELCPSDLEQEIRPFIKNKQVYNVQARPSVLPNHPGSDTKYLDLVLVPVVDMQGEAEMFILTIKDVTDDENTQRELAKYRDRLEELVEERTAELKNAQNELVRNERLATLGKLTATVSHEIRNPLGAMRPSIYIIEKRSDKNDERVQQAIERIDRNIDRCDHIIDELLDFTRITDLDLHLTHIDEWLESVVDEQDVPKDIRIEKNFSLNGLELAIDTAHMQRAIINVMENACHAMMVDERTGEVSKGSCLCIKTVENDGRIKIIISDNGVGISSDILGEIFEPLFSTRAFGVGLGMPTIKQIMEQHGGGIEVNSEEGKGTTVILWLPTEMTDENGSEVEILR